MKIKTVVFHMLAILALTGVALPAQKAIAAPLSQGIGGESFGQSVVQPTQIKIAMSSTQPKMTPEQLAQKDASLSQSRLPGPVTPIGPNATTRNAPPMVPETRIGNGGQKAAGTFTIFKNISLAGGPSKSQVNEPSVANNGRDIFATYNWYAGLSKDYGNTWAYIDPATAFPASYNGFCCDQDVFYDPSRDLTVWLLQYVANPTTGNALRLAVAKGQTNLESGVWTYWDFAPSNYGGLASDWFDYPHLTRTNNNLYLSANVFSSVSAFKFTVMIRLPLDQLSAGGGVTSDWVGDPGFTFTAAQGGTDTLYFARHVNTTTLRVYTWPESLPYSGITFNDVSHASYLNGSYNCTVTASSANPCGRDDDRLTTGWLRRSNNELAFMWDASQGTDGLGTFGYPYARVLTMNATTKAVITDAPIWSSSVAWIMPSSSGNARGHVGGTIAYAGGTYQPNCAAWLYDDFSAGISPLEVAPVSGGDTSPAINRWGDYLRTRQNGANPFQFIGTCYAIEAGVTTPRIVTFGRARDIGAGADTVGVFRPSNGALYLKNTNANGFADYVLTYGLPGDYPVVGDWTGSGVDSIGIYRNGIFYLRNSNTNGFADIVFAFGAPGDQPVVGDWNGDGIDTVGVYRSSTGTFFLRNSNSAGPADMTFSLGIAGDVGIAGDWTGKGFSTTGVFRPSNGALYLKNTNATGFADTVLTYGLPGDKPVTGDWNHDGIDTIGIYRGDTFYLRNSNTNGFADINVTLGLNGDMPIAGNWDGIP